MTSILDRFVMAYLTNPGKTMPKGYVSQRSTGDDSPILFLPNKQALRDYKHAVYIPFEFEGVPVKLTPKLFGGSR